MSPDPGAGSGGLDHDVIVIGGGHNGLVAAAYLARAGLRVVVLEGRGEFGGAVASRRLFSGVDARVSRFSYLVSLLPDRIVQDLDLQLELRSRSVKSYSPVGDTGLLVERPEGPVTRASFARLTGDDRAYAAWQRLEAELETVAAMVAPTLTDPLPRAAALRARIDPALWRGLVERPIGELIEERFDDDTVRGVVLTDALIGTFAGANDAELAQNRCFLYHVIGNGTGEWRVPVGGMGALATELTRVAEATGADLRLGAKVTAVHPVTGGGARVVLADGSSLTAPYVLANCAPATLGRLLGEPVAAPSGSQLKINMVLRRLPRLRSGLDPEVGFAGTLHLAQGYDQLQTAHASAAAGQVPDPMPGEVYCHTLTDPSILGPELRAAGFHTLTLFGLHAPAELFRADPEGTRDVARDAALRSLQAVLAEPLEDCLALDDQSRPCLEVMTPLDVEAETGMPGGHIFHGNLSWPWLPDGVEPAGPAECWGVSTAYPGLLLCGSGAVRGGAVSGIGGHNAAMAVLEMA